ncbi:MAG: hypothetical protein ACJAXX_001356 [Roseivirga sp.]|jgi:hypothetical protein
MKHRNRSVVVLFVLLLAFSACKTEYEKTIQNELASGVQYDSLFLGLEFGQTRKEFFDLCWELNKSIGLQPSGKGTMLGHILTTRGTDNAKIKMKFYPTFNKEDKINGMDLEFSYMGWSPWAEQYQADKLLPAVIDTFENWYGRNTFSKLSFEKDPKEIWVKVDGNRRLAIFQKDVEILEMKITNLLDEREDGEKK